MEKNYYSQTHSLKYEIETEDVYQEFGMIGINTTIATILIILLILIKQKKSYSQVQRRGF